MEYGQYLQSKHWKNTRLTKLATYPRCQICYSTSNIQIHHKHYKNKSRDESILFREKVTNLITLCASCHRFLHHYFGIDVQKLNKKICRIRRLLELGAIKKYAFYGASQNELFISIKSELEKMYDA